MVSIKTRAQENGIVCKHLQILHRKFKLRNETIQHKFETKIRPLGPCLYSKTI